MSLRQAGGHVLGRRREVAPGPHFRLKNYLDHAALPAPPASIDYTTAASSPLADVYGNDALGDCVVAALYHLLALWTGNASGTPFHASLDQVIAMYSAIGGYVPGNPATDQGCDMTTAMNWIVANGFANGDKPVGWVRIDGANAAEVQAAIWLFEGVDFGVGLPDAYVSPFPSGDGFTWDVAGDPDQNNGHSFMAAGYDAAGATIDTWGMLGKFTWAAIAKYAVVTAGGEIDVLLSLDMIAKGATKAPSGFDWQGLIANFDSMGGTVPAPAPSPPSPVTGPATLANAQAWAAAGVNAGAPLMTRAQAATAANAGLAAGWPSGTP